MTHLHDPAAGPGVRVLSFLALLLTARPDVRLVAVRLGCLPALRIVVPLVCTQMVRLFVAGLWPSDHDRFKGICQELHIIPIRSGNHDRDREAMAFGQDAALGAAFATVRRVRPRGFLAKGALVIAPSMLCQVHSSP